jgi:hypothetical protein
MKTKDVTIHSVFLVYWKLLEHIEWSNESLRNKTTPWKRGMYDALLAARQKLKECYEKTYRDHGFLYGTGTLLAPQYKLCAFDDTEYSKCQSETSTRYCDYLRKCFCTIPTRSARDVVSCDAFLLSTASIRVRPATHPTQYFPVECQMRARRSRSIFERR